MLMLTFKATFHKLIVLKSLLYQVALYSLSHCWECCGVTFHSVEHTLCMKCEIPASRPALHQAADLCSPTHVGDMFPVALRSSTWQGHGAAVLSQALHLKKKNLNEEQPGAISIVLGSY